MASEEFKKRQEEHNKKAQQILSLLGGYSADDVTSIVSKVMRKANEIAILPNPVLPNATE